MLIGISGKKYSGKDTAYLALASAYPGAVRVAFADALKKEVAAACGATVAHVEATKAVFRPLLQAWGVWRREEWGTDYWLQRVADTLSKVEGDLAIVTDVRFENEAQFVLDRGGVLLRIVRPGIEAGDSHLTETALDNYPFEHVIINDGSLLQFHRKVFTWWESQLASTGAAMEGFELV